MIMQNDIFLLSPIDNLDDGCWSTFTFFCTYNYGSWYRVQYSHTPQESAYFSEKCVRALITFFLFLVKWVSWQISHWTLFISAKTAVVIEEIFKTKFRGQDSTFHLYMNIYTNSSCAYEPKCFILCLSSCVFKNIYYK